MDLESIIQSTKYLEFINSLDNLIFELLYSKEEGYINLSSKEAIKEFEPVILKFKNEAQKLANTVQFSEKDKILEEKFDEFLIQMKKHYKKEAINRAKEAFKERIENCLLKASINKNDSKKRDLIYSNGISAINWILETENADSTKRNALIKDFNEEFKLALIKKDEEYLSKNNPEKSDIKTFLKFYNLILDDPDKFRSLNLDSKTDTLNQSDTTFLKQKQQELSNFKKTGVIDEINFILSAINCLNIKTEEDKYNFIKQVYDDFNLFISDNKKIEYKDKIEIIKKRVNLFYEKDRLNYFKKALNSAATV